MSPAERIRYLADKWAAKHPRLRSRIDRAVALTANVTSQCEGVYVVEGSNGAEYIVAVNFDRGTSICTCEDHRRGNHCKHRIAVALVHVIETKAV